MEGGFYYRNPTSRSGVFSNDNGQTLLVADLSADGSANCPVVPIADHLPDANALANVSANPNCFAFVERFPGGFTPQFGGEVDDRSLAIGIRGSLSDDWSYDLSAVTGQHRTEFYMENTINPQLAAQQAGYSDELSAGSV